MDRDQFRATAVGLLAAAAVFAVMFYVVNAREVLRAMTSAEPALLLAVGGVILLWNVSWGLVLWTVLRALDVHLTVLDAVIVNAAAAFANHVTPFGQAGGEPVTAWLLSRRADTEYEIGLAGVASLDAINVVPSVTFAVVGGAYFLLVTPVTIDLGYVPAAVVVVLVAAAVAALTLRSTDLGVAERADRALVSAVRGVTRHLPGVPVPDRDAVTERVERFVDAVGRVGNDRRRLAAALGLSATGWALQALALWLTFLALDARLPLYVALFVVPIGAVGGALPTPGGLGGIEAINVTLITLVTGLAASTVAAAVTIHSVGGYILTTSIGAAATSVLGVQR